MVLEESRQTEDDRRDCDGDDVAVCSLYGAQSLGVQRSTYSDIPIYRQQNRQPRVHHAQDVSTWKQPGIKTDMYVFVIIVVDQRCDIAQRTQHEYDDEKQCVSDCQRLQHSTHIRCTRHATMHYVSMAGERVA